MALERRKFIKSIGVGGIAAVGFPKKIAFGRDDTVEIVTDVLNDSSIHTKKVPKEWYELVERSRRIKRELSNEFSSEIHSVVRKYSDNQIGVHRVPFLEIRTEREISVPEEIGGVSIEITDDIPDLIRECDDSTSTCLPSGTSISRSSWGGTDGTLGPSIHYNDGTRDFKGFMTAAHVVTDDWCTFIEGETMYDGTFWGDLVGTVERWSWIQDYAVLKANGDYDPRGSLVNESPTTWGYITKDGIEDMASTGEEVRKFGQATCMTEGPVLGIGDHVDACGGERFEAIELNYSSDDGDSGGPVYVIRQSHNWTWVSMLGIHIGNFAGTRVASPIYIISDFIERIGVHGC